jgi:Transglutaminase-like superfamily
MLRKLRRLRHAPLDRQLLLVEITLHLLLARLALRVLPFRWLVWWFQRPARQPELQGAARRAVCEDMRIAVYFTNEWLALNAVCFPVSIATQTMLRRRRVSTTLYYGAATVTDTVTDTVADLGKLTAHVWLQDGAEGIVGHEDISQFQILARYSSQPVSARHQ